MTIEERVAELERKNRRLTWMLTVAGGTVALLAVLTSCTGMTPAGNAPQESVTARQFVLVDEKGESRAELAVIGDMPGLALADENGKTRAQLTVTDKGPALELYNEKGKLIVAIGAPEDGGGGIVEVFNSSGIMVATIQANKRNCGSVAVFDFDGKPKRALTAN
ncbi:MAG: hypothetical protein KKA28_05920 [Planctomycetes bacterium]|nr:hypothetical protein [Planctomycetota bacterium]MCG2684263.1 hypothetical protein [Planctomycetales bacterium]MCG2818836.1 hypothetical protein [Actinomycetes bacterium]